FSRGELSETLNIPINDIVIAPNGADHLSKVDDDNSILKSLKLHRRRYFLFVGSPTPNKNLSTAVKAFRSLNRSDARLVLVGALAKGIFGGDGLLQGEGVVMAGRLSDGEIARLYQAATALVFPSLYEGFGIPPL